MKYRLTRFLHGHNFHRLILIALIALTTSGGLFDQNISRAAEPTALDIIPANATVAVAIQSVEDLSRKGDKLIEQGKIKMFIRPSQVFDIGFSSYLGIIQGIDKKAPTAIVMANLHDVGTNLDSFNNWDQLLVFVVPFTDRKLIAANFGLKAGQLRPDTIVENKGDNTAIRYLYSRGKHIIAGSNRKAVLSVAKGKSLREALGKQRQKNFDGSEMVVTIGTLAWGKSWKNMLRDVEESLKTENDKAANATTAQFVKALSQVRFVVAGIKIDDGLSVRIETVFPEQGADEAKKFLHELAGGKTSAALTGLPNRPVIAAFAARGDGTKNIAIAQTAMKVFLRDFADGEPVLSPAADTELIRLVSHVWRNLSGSRAALYPTRDAKKLGQFTAISILDTSDPEKMLSEMPKWIRLANEAVAKAGKGAGLERAKFTYQTKAKAIEGCRVDFLSVNPEHLPAAIKRESATLFGPNWHRIQLAIQGRQIVIQIGSDDKLLGETLRNLASNKPGLTGHPPLVKSGAYLGKERKVEFYFSSASAIDKLGLQKNAPGDNTDTKKTVAKQAFSSVGLSIDENHIGLSLWFPMSEIRAAGRLFPF